MKKTILLGILILAFALRFYKLDSYPALNADEAAIGYNAYSLIQTGKDEHGNSWPIHFQSFNDYKPGLYFYLVLPFVKLFGLGEWAVRIPNALFGVATVYLVYLLVRELYKDRLAVQSSLISAFFLAISPWHIHYSRGGWEVNTATFFIVLGVYLFLKFISLKKHFDLFMSFLSFVLSLYTYHSARVIAPLIGLGLVFIYRSEILKKENIKLLATTIALLVFFLVPLAVDITKSGALSRARGVGILADVGPVNRVNEQRGEHQDFNSSVTKFLHNKYIGYAVRFADNYTSHFSGEFLFMTGDGIQRNKVPETGVLYLFDILLLVFGLRYIAKNNTKENVLIIYWLLISPIASSLTFQSPNALRSQNMIIPIIIICALGFKFLFDFFSSRKMSVLNHLLLVVIFWCLVRYLYFYYNFMSKEYPFSSQYGVKEMVEYVNKNKDSYKDVVITDRYDQPYILYLFYSKYNPLDFQNSHRLTPTDEYGFSTVRDFGKFHFYSIKYDEMRVDYPNSLIVGTSDEIPEATNIVQKIYGSNGYNYFDIVAN